jgi:hypothetical protein
MSGADTDGAKIVNIASLQAHCWLRGIAKLAHPYDYLWSQGVDLDDLDMLHGPIARYNYFDPEEADVVLPVFMSDGKTPLDVVVFSMKRPTKFVCLLGLGGVLGANAVVNPATYAGGKPCKLVRTPLKWLKAGIKGHAVVLDPVRARPLLDQAPGDLEAEDFSHADQLVRSGAVDGHRLMTPEC